MALIEVFHVTASSLPIDANNSVDIPQGLLVSLEGTGDVQPAHGDNATQLPIGIAGDTRSTGVTSFTPESGSARSRNPKTSYEGALVTGAWGASQRFTENRVSDGYNEVLASGKMTVYHSGGEFWTDQYEVVQSSGSVLATYASGTALFASGAETAGGAPLGEPEDARSGRFTDEASTANSTTSTIIPVGVTLTAPTSYPSGVPGTETAFQSLPEGGNSLAWGTFLHVKLLV